MSIQERLSVLRNQMQQHKIDIYLVPSIDAHNSEYVPECWQRRPWISNFDGSAGEVIVTLDHAYLWTDGRYFLQAEQQLDSNHYTMMKQGGFAPETEQWLQENAHGKRLGIDARLVGIGRANILRNIMSSIDGELVVLEENLVDNAKTKLGESINLPCAKAFAVHETTTGESLVERLAWLRSELTSNQAEYIALNVLDEIAWLYNIRGSDVEFNPFVISYALIGLDEAIWFVDSAKLSVELIAELATAGVTIQSYDSFAAYVGQLHAKIWLDERSASFWMLQSVSSSNEVLLQRSPIVYRKALKNAVEAEGARVAHIKDAVAMIRFIYWLEQNWQTGVDEISAADKLEEFRKAQANLHGLSFSTISGYASNGAIIHYRATPDTNKVIRDDNLYLLDSGGQYLEGTTDITRTFHLGTPSDQQRHHYTLVLKGHLALSRAIFSHGTCGEHLDTLARAPLWNEFLNYRHGTGHGVGSFLGVHEGPQKISQANSNVPLVPGMIISNEPGLYLDGEYGIRIENLCLVTEVDDTRAKQSPYGPFYTFEDLTLVPYCKKLIDTTLLSPEDKAQINTYYAKIRSKIAPHLDSQLQAWLFDQLDLL
ncbi:MAG: aminopeptidase P family protein [Neisseriaceae bacterium]|nr:MAG: aminopeptidase P family protein [Neisseriaceae bacterium]